MGLKKGSLFEIIINVVQKIEFVFKLAGTPRDATGATPSSTSKEDIFSFLFAYWVTNEQLGAAYSQDMLVVD